MKISTTLLLCVLSLVAIAQDERSFRAMYSGELATSGAGNLDNYKVAIQSDPYEIDLNRDGKNDSIQTIKKDGVDFFRVNDEYGKKVFESKLETKGARSRIFRASFKTISKDIDVLLLHFYEGDTKLANFEGSARLYIITIKNRDLKNLSMKIGPYFWTEKEKTAGQYWTRRYTVSTEDFNKDGTKEILVRFNRITKVLYYTNKERWKSF